MNLDDLDRRILACLEIDGRATHAAIGRELGITGPAVYARVKRMEDSGVIRGYRVNVDPVLVGRPLAAFIRITTRPIKVETDTLEPYVWTEDRIEACHDIAAEDTYILKARCASPEDLRDLLLRLRARPQVIRTTSSVVLASVKEPGMPRPEQPLTVR